MHFIGDLSDQDVAVLGRAALTATWLLEFGCGGSTQVLANYSRPQTYFFSVDTEQAWIDRTRENCRRLGIRRQFGVNYLLWDATQPPPIPRRAFDLIFIDGLRDLRLPFARAAWGNLADGGTLYWHDCRREKDLREIGMFVQEHVAAVQSLQVAVEESNLAAITKRTYLPLQDWHQGKELWELGAAPPPAELPWPLP